MRVALFGGTGFVGRYLVESLVNAGITPVVLARQADKQLWPGLPTVEMVTGDVNDSDAVDRVLARCDAAIYNIGILRESPKSGITFDNLQNQAAKRVIDAAQRHGVRRFLLMSANGVDAEQTRYQKTKRQAEHHLENSDLEWTIFRPSVIFGDPQGRMEFATQLKRDIIDSPLPAPLFFGGLNPAEAGGFKLSPVHVQDVATAFAAALLWTPTVHKTLHLGGPSSLSWREILETIASASGCKKAMLPVPVLGVSTAAALFDRWERFPITREQIQMLMEGNECDPGDLSRLGIDPKPFNSETLAYLTTQSENQPWQQNAA